MSTIKGVLSEIGSAIRSKTGSTSTIPASDLATNIASIGGTAPNGTAWTRASGLTGSIQNFTWSVCKGNGTWVACANVNTTSNAGFWYSNDGKNWTPATGYPTNTDDGTNLSGKKVMFVESFFFATDANNYLWVSEDGADWARLGSGDIRTTGALQFVTYHMGKWVLACNGGLVCISDDPSMASSCTIGTLSDGSYLTRAFSFVQRGEDGVLIAGGGGVGGLYRSTDGVTWTAVDGVSNSEFTCALCHNGIWYAGTTGFVGTAEGPTMYISSDSGQTWTYPSMPIPAGTAVNCLCPVSFGRVLAGTKEYGIWITEGSSEIIWNEVEFTDSSVVTEATVLDIRKHSGIVIAILNGYIVWTSSLTPEANWTRIESDTQLRTMQSVYNADGLWVAGGRCGAFYSRTW